jgi:lysophospholipase
VAAVAQAARAMDLPGPWFVLGHSMGGAIGLRAIYEGLPVRAAAFSAPMWGIRLSPLMRPVAWALAGAASAAGLGGRYVPGMNGVTYVHSAPYEGNVLSSDPDMYSYMKRQVTDRPDLAIGGPSMGWLYEALRECRDLAARASPALPCHCAVGPAERVVDIPAIEDRMARWPGASFDRIDGAEHELMMERPPIRARFYDAAARLFDAQPR